MGSATQCRGLLDYLVCLEKQGRRQRQAKSLRSFQIDDQLKLHGLFHRQVAWLGALQDSIDVVGGTPMATASSLRRKWSWATCR
jgi:hypothetical protein